MGAMGEMTVQLALAFISAYSLSPDTDSAGIIMQSTPRWKHLKTMGYLVAEDIPPNKKFLTY